jgi:hypothetical protein
MILKTKISGLDIKPVIAASSKLTGAWTGKPDLKARE